MKNRFDIHEWAGALGDLGTFIPFVVGYVTIVGISPIGILLSFGSLLIASGLYYRVPVPIQPMKAIGAAAIAGGASVNIAMICSATIFTGLFWLLLGISGFSKHISRLVSKPVLKGIILGLGLAFMLNGLQLVRTSIWIGLFGLALVFFLQKSGKIPSLLVLLSLGIIYAIVLDPESLDGLRLGFHLSPGNASFSELNWNDAIKGILILAIPQIPLTLGNAVYALVDENNRLFPQRLLTEKKIMISHGIINLVSALFGGIPICHGAGGMAGHVRFGAKTGGSLIILGSLMIVMAVLFGDSVVVMLKLIPDAVLGVILFFAGLELALSARDSGFGKTDYMIMLVTAAVGIINMGAGFLAGILLDLLLKKNKFRK